MNEIVKKTLNRGAPIDTPILLNMGDFLQVFDDDKLSNEYREAIKSIICSISNILIFHAGDTFIPVFATLTLGDDNIKELRISGENIFTSIHEILYPMDIMDIIDSFESSAKIEEFKKRILAIKTPEELSKKFPRLFELYNGQLELNNGLNILSKVLDDPKASMSTKRQYLEATVSYLKEFYPEINITREQEFARNFTLERYLNRMFDVITTALVHGEEITEIYQSGTIELDNFNPEDADKLDLFIAANFMDRIELEQVKEKQRYLFFLTNYFKDNVETKVTRTKIKYHERKVTPINLYERYKKVLVENPDLLAVNFTPADFRDMDKEEIEEFIVAYLSDLFANWELIPEEDTSIEREIRSIAKRKYHKLSAEEQKQKQEKLIKLYMDKKSFYDSTDPYFRIKGKNTFDGYVGYIYPNSIVVLEKFYADVDKKKIAENEAIYILTMADFYELSQHSKSYLIANHLCHRVIHKDGWQQRVLRYIKRRILGANPADDTNKLIGQKKISLNEKKLN